MPRLFIGNFDFEHTLHASMFDDSLSSHSARSAKQLPAKLIGINAQLATVWLAVAQEDDFLWTPQEIPDAFLEQAQNKTLASITRIVDIKQFDFQSLKTHLDDRLELVPWGWTEQWVQFASDNELTCNAPAMAAVSRANSRVTSFLWEHQWNIQPPCCALVTSEKEVSSALKTTEQVSNSWVIKSEFGMSGRERILGSGSELKENQHGWIRKRLLAGHRVIIEPWFEKTEEVSLHWQIEKENVAPAFVGITQLLSSEQGAYSGSRLFSKESEILLLEAWESTYEITQRACLELQSLGYYGAVGFDAMKIVLEDGVQERSLVDINARYSMGRMALEFQKRYFPNQDYEWEIQHQTHLNQN